MSEEATLCLGGLSNAQIPPLYVVFISWWQLKFYSPFTRLSSSKKGGCDLSFFKTDVLLGMQEVRSKAE